MAGVLYDRCHVSVARWLFAFSLLSLLGWSALLLEAAASVGFALEELGSLLVMSSYGAIVVLNNIYIKEMFSQEVRGGLLGAACLLVAFSNLAITAAAAPEQMSTPGDFLALTATTQVLNMACAAALACAARTAAAQAYASFDDGEEPDVLGVTETHDSP